MKILIADDSKTALSLISMSLKKLGHTVIPTTNGEEAIRSFIDEKPDLVILDVMMEGMSGFQCAKKIREIESEDWIPIIFLSGSVDDASIVQGIDAGGDDYLTKPCSAVTLSAKIKAMQRISDMRKQLYEATCKLKVLSSIDVLTGTYNRLQFELSFTEKIAYAKRHNLPLALLFIDLDNFKLVNDFLGHNVGDLLLKEVSKELQSCIREYDFLARIGGDEFAMILSDINKPEEAAVVANRVVSTIFNTYKIADHQISIGCSIGIALYPNDGVQQQILMRNADIAMYYAKEMGRNNYQFYTSEMLERYNNRIHLKELELSSLNFKQNDLE